MPLQNLVAEGNETLFISGSYIRPVAIRDLLINETGKQARRCMHTVNLAKCISKTARLHFGRLTLLLTRQHHDK